MRWPMLITLLLSVLASTINARSQGAIPCDVNPECDVAEPAPKPKTFEFQIEVRPVKPKVVKPPIVKPKVVTSVPLKKPVVATKKPAAKPKPVAAVKKKPLNRPARKPVFIPAPSWEGLTETPVPVLIGDDFADIAGQYIVDLNPAAFTAAGLDLLTIPIPDLATRLGVLPTQIRSVQRRFLRSVVLSATPAQAAAIARNPLVLTVHADTKIKAAGGEVKRPLSWGLDRLDLPTLPLDGKFDRDSGNYAARLYMLDTGIDRSHLEFGNRVIWGARFAKALPDTSGHCRDHGTEMASLVTGTTTGAAPKTEVVDVVVLPCSRRMTGEASSLIEAAEWLLIREADEGDGKPAIVNMSLAGKWSRKINAAVSVMTDNGLAVVVAAGNNGEDACRFSPASAKDAVTVAATGPSDETPGFSNFGSCVDVYAPGRYLTAVSAGTKDFYVASSGTSGAAALVSGLLARAVKTKGAKAASAWLSEAAAPAAYWRKGNDTQGEPSLLLAQARPLWRSLCKLAAPAQLRDRPGPAARKLATIEAGAAVEIEDIANGWARVSVVGGGKGWLASKGKTRAIFASYNGGGDCEALK